MDGGKVLHHVLQNPQLRTVAIFQKHFQAAVMIEIGECECPAIFDKIETDRARHVGESSVTIVRVENISFVAAPGAVGPDKFVDAHSSLVHRREKAWLYRRVRDYLPPKETVQIVARRPRHHSVGDVKVRKTIVIEIPGVARPGPSAHSNTCGSGIVVE